MAPVPTRQRVGTGGASVHRLGSELSTSFDKDASTDIAAAAVLRDAVAIGKLVGARIPDAWTMMTDRIVPRSATVSSSIDVSA